MNGIHLELLKSKCLFDILPRFGYLFWFTTVVG